jgi:hypothetical protein
MPAGESIVYSPNKRKETRVIFTRTITLFAQEQAHGQYRARNLSLGGLFLEGNIDIPVGADCRLELHEINRHSSLNLNFYGKILRQENDGVGVQFTDMENDSFMFLQTLVLYSSHDPIGIAEKFFEDFSTISCRTAEL